MCYEFYAVWRLSDYRTSLSLKGKRLFYTKKYATIWRWFVRKYNDYYSATISGQPIAIRYIGLSNGRHLTTLRLFYDYFLCNYYVYMYIITDIMQRLLHDYWLRLFQPERYDYWWPLLAIGRKPEKRCGGSRQWFRAARRRLHGLRYAAPSGMDP